MHRNHHIAAVEPRHQHMPLPQVITAVPSFPVMPCRMGIPFEWTGAANRPIKLMNLDKSDFTKHFEVVPGYPRDLFGERTAGAQGSEFDKRLSGMHQSCRHHLAVHLAWGSAR